MENGKDLDTLINELKDDDPMTRFGAAEKLGIIADKKAVNHLISALNDEYEAVRKHAAISLGKIGDKRALHPLIQGLKDQTSSGRAGAAQGLGLLGDQRAVEPLHQAIEQEDSYFSKGAADVKGIAAKAIENLQRDGTNKNTREGFSGMHSREEEDSPQTLKSHSRDTMVATTLEELKDLLEAKDVNSLIETLRRAGIRAIEMDAAVALGKIGDSKAIAPLISTLTNEYKWPGTRICAAEALAVIGGEKATQALEQTTRSLNREVAEKAEAMLRVFGLRPEVPPSSNKLQQPKKKWWEFWK